MMKITNPLNKWRESRRASVEPSSRYAGEHAGYDTTPLPRLTWKGFSMGVLVSMGTSHPLLPLSTYELNSTNLSHRRLRLRI